MKPLHQVIEDAVTIRGIIDYLEKSVEPVSLHELAMTQHISVSIPIGFSSSLQQRPMPDSSHSMEGFQSLSGFQVRCNQAPGLPERVVESGFNPYRVFKFVATLEMPG